MSNRSICVQLRGDWYAFISATYFYGMCSWTCINMIVAFCRSPIFEWWEWPNIINVIISMSHRCHQSPCSFCRTPEIEIYSKVKKWGEKKLENIRYNKILIRLERFQYQMWLIVHSIPLLLSCIWLISIVKVLIMYTHEIELVDQ